MWLKCILKFFNPLRLLLILISMALLWFAIWGDKGIYEREKLRFIKAKLQEERVSLQNEIIRLNKEKELLKNKNLLEGVIRTELGYIRPGEVILELKNNPENEKK